MASLSAHLREPGDHGRLAFHPECPVCRDRLAGVLPADAIVGRRAQALVAAGTLALASGTPTAALAATADQQEGVPPPVAVEVEQDREGAVAAPEVVTADPTVDSDFDPGGESTDLPFVAGAAPQPQVSPDDAIPIEDEAATEGEQVVADLGDGLVTPGVTPQQPPPTSQAPAPPPPPSPPPSEPPAAVPAPEAAPAPPMSGATAPARERDERKTGEQRNPAATPHADRAPSTPQAEPVEAPSTVIHTTTTVQATQSQPAPTPSPVTSESRAARGDRAHVVLPGESLWSIARDLLGRDASVAAIAREVNRLWELNEDRIGTGNPDLVIAGTRLALR